MQKIPKKLLSGKPNFVETNRRWTVIKRHLPIITKPLIVGVVGALLWKFIIFDNQLGFTKESENPLLFLILPLVSFVYVIFASIAVGSVFDEYKTISRAVVQNDLDTYLVHRDEQLPILIHILMGAPSILLTVLAMLFHYDNMWIGAVSLFSVIFVVVSTWLVATELDDFKNGIWFKHNIPEDWNTIDVREYFKAKR
jgi:hypothetical protein